MRLFGLRFGCALLTELEGVVHVWIWLVGCVHVQANVSFLEDNLYFLRIALIIVCIVYLRLGYPVVLALHWWVVQCLERVTELPISILSSMQAVQVVEVLISIIENYCL